MSAELYPTPATEQTRLRALAEYGLLDTPPEEDFDRIVGLASRLFNVPIVLISLIGADRQFFKAKVGLDVCETGRDVSFCAHAIVQDGILVVPDAREDARFASNPLVLGRPNIRFYAGAPLVAPGGEKVGTVCLIDQKPRWAFSLIDRMNLSDIAALVMDRMEMRRLDHAESVSQFRFKNIASTSPDAIVCTNADAVITFWNTAAEKLFEYSAEEAAGQPISIIIPDQQRQLHGRELNGLAEVGRAMAGSTIELPARRRDGSEFPAEFSFSMWPDGHGLSIGAIVRDITERRENEKRLYRLASLDTLTELPNRLALQTRMEQVLAHQQPAALLLLDLDGFKDVNDTLGHSAGNQVLKKVSELLSTISGSDGMVARLGGDEFVVLLTSNDPTEAGTAAAALVSAISAPLDLGGEVIHIGVSIGVALAPLHGAAPDELLGAADLALYQAKAAGRGRYEFFAPAMRQVAIARRVFEQDLRRAYAEGEFELYYQPQVSLRDGSLTGAEALLRWNHPERGVLAPGAFLDILSGTSLAHEVGEWTLRAACAQAAAWRAVVPRFRMGVNLFEAQFRSGRLVSSVEGALEQSRLPPDALELEITENIFLRQDQATSESLLQLRAMGVGLAFDDYGTGFASLSMLKRYPVTRLKIDRSFVRDICFDAEDAAVVRAILYLGESFGLDVIAEGVETSEQEETLRQYGCVEAQGYLFGKPMTASVFSRHFAQERLKRMA